MDGGLSEAGARQAEWNRALSYWLDHPAKYSERPPRPPVPVADLKQRLELLTKYGVRTYRDGILSLDLDPERLRKRGVAPDPNEQPEVPEM